MVRKLNEASQINKTDNIVPTFYHSLFLTEYVLDSPSILLFVHFQKSVLHCRNYFQFE